MLDTITSGATKKPPRALANVKEIVVVMFHVVGIFLDYWDILGPLDDEDGAEKTSHL